MMSITARGLDSGANIVPRSGPLGPGASTSDWTGVWTASAGASANEAAAATARTALMAALLLDSVFRQIPNQSAFVNRIRRRVKSRWPKAADLPSRNSLRPTAGHEPALETAG